jgi:ribosomal protein S12 methylthiotransferase
MTVSLISLGCPKNLVDSEIILGNLVKAKFTLTNDWKNADIVIINTCAFLQSAVKEAEQWICTAISCKKKGRIKKIIVAGCLSQRYKQKLFEKFPKIDSIIGIDDISDIQNIFVGQGFSPAKKSRPFTKTGSCREGLPYISEKVYHTPKYLYNCTTPRLLTTNHYAYIKIADGCDNYCSYCLIPKIRGRFRSREIDDIIKEAKNLALQGVKEIILIAQDTTLYGKDIYRKLSLARLLKQLVKIKTIDWIRVLYTHPAHWTDELIKVFKDYPKICRYIDLPLQHISDNMLQLMNRPYNREAVETLLTKLKKIPNIAIRTSFITGFPGETEKDFQELLSFVKAQKFAHLGCFEYSREQGTVAYNLPNQISQNTKKIRYNKIMIAQQKISYNRMKRFIGKKIKVIIDEISKNRKYNSIGRTEFDAPEIDCVVYIKSRKFKVGDFINTKITSAKPYSISGHL